MLLPFLLVVILAVVQVGVIGRDYVLVQHAVRDSARLVALDPSQATAADAAAASGLDPDRLDVQIRGGQEPGDIMTVELRYQVATDVPVIGALLDDVAVSAEASVRVE